MAQGFPWRLAAVLLLSSLPAQACEPAPVRWQSLATGLWLVEAAADEAGPGNRGRVTNQVLAVDGRRRWLIGAGPTPAWARALDCAVRRRFGGPVTDVVVPWARAEQALGLAGYARARRWAHADVAATMARQCPDCEAALRSRLGEAAADLGDAPVRIPDRRLDGPAGRLGPWQWQRLERAAGQAVTTWSWRGGAVVVAPGLLWNGAPPDGRGADLERLRRSTERLAATGGAAVRWVGEQGAPMDAGAAAAQAGYWRALQAAAEAAVARGALPTDTPPPADGMPEAWHRHPQHALNWQHAWRDAEDRWLAPAR